MCMTFQSILISYWHSDILLTLTRCPGDGPGRDCYVHVTHKDTDLVGEGTCAVT